MTEPPPLRLTGLFAGRAGVPAVRDLDLTVAAGEIVALLGPNGAGKTTTLDTVAGVLPPLAGTAEVLGRSVDGTAAAARAGLSYLPERRGLFAQLTVRENLRLRTRRRGSADRMLLRFPVLERVADRRAGLLSGGEQQVLGLACALATRPRLLLIDEMTMGLAPIVVTQLLELVRRAAEDGVAVLFVEQHVHAALQLATRAYVLRQGALVMSGTTAELSSRLGELHDSYFDLALDARPAVETSPSAPGRHPRR